MSAALKALPRAATAAQVGTLETSVTALRSPVDSRNEARLDYRG